MGWDAYEMNGKERKPGGGINVFRGTSCISEPGPTAFQCIKNNDLRSFVDILNSASDERLGEDQGLDQDHWINQPIEGEDGHTLLTASINQDEIKFVEVLLRAGAIPDLYNAELNKYPIHVAASGGNVPCMKMLLKAGADVNRTNKLGRSALHIASERNDVEMVDFLLKLPKIDVNLKDKKGGQTALYIAVKNKSPQLVEMLIENGSSLDTVCYGKSIQAHIEEKMPSLNTSLFKPVRAPLEREMSSNSTERLFSMVDQASLTGEANLGEFNSLILQMDVKSLTRLKSGGLSLLQKCCAGGLHQYVDALLGEGLDPNFCPAESLSAPVLIAAYRGSYKVMEILKSHNADFSVLKKQTEESVLHRVLLERDGKPVPETKECLRLLLSTADDEFKAQIDRIINKKDILGNTPLHYAAQKWDQEVVRMLLERGANIGIKNKWGEIPIEKIESTTMEAFLDTFCLTSSNDVNHEDFELTFKYNFLAPPVENLPPEVQGPYSDDEESQKISDKYSRQKFALPETESLWYMAQTKEHRYLLKHPVITSFLWCKWNRIRRYFNRNLRFYFLFVTLLTWYVFERFGGESIRAQPGGRITFCYGFFVVFSVAMFIFIIKDWISDIKDLVDHQNAGGYEPGKQRPESKPVIILVFRNWLEVAYLAGLSVILWLGVDCLSVALLILLIGLAFRELFQMAVSLRRYFLDLENLVEVVMIALTAIILLRPDAEDGPVLGGGWSLHPAEDTQERELKRHLAAISLFLSWAELITFVAKHPRLNIYNVYVTMFYKVLSTFFFFLLWYIFFILAFGLGFYIMLHNDFKDSNVTDSDYEFFNSPGLSLVKVSTMFVGELEFSDIPVNLEGSMMPLSYIFFLTFVFLIVVVLMNLLNGLAVSDTGLIQEQSEIVSYLSRVETISYAESLLLGDPFDFLSSWPRLNFLVNCPSLSFCRQFYRNRTARKIFQKVTGATNILLFYNYLPHKELKIKPNRSSNTCTMRKSLPKDILDSARKIIVAKASQDKSTALEEKLERLEEKLDLLLKKLDI